MAHQQTRKPAHASPTFKGTREENTNQEGADKGADKALIGTLIGTLLLDL